MNKRGISSVVANVLIVLLVVGAIAIMWGFIRPLIVESGDEIGTEQFTLNLKIVDDSVRIHEDSNNHFLQKIKIQRKAGKGELVGAKIILVGETGNSIIWPEEGLAEVKELETTYLDFTDDDEDGFPDGLNGGIDYSSIGTLLEIGIAPVWETNKGKEKVGAPTDIYEVSGEEFKAGVCFGGVSDGVLQDPPEECDGSEFGGITCENIFGAGYGGTLGCTNFCSYETSQCEFCGDGIVNGQEECEIEETKSCTDSESYPGTQTCSDSCSWNACDTGGLACGDGKITTPPEACDYEEGSYDVNTCSVDYVLDCASENTCDFCSDGTSGEACSVGTLSGGCCGDGLGNGGEFCDAGDSNGQYNSGCNANCSGVGPYCGDGILNGLFGENCDDGTGNRASCTPTYPDGTCEYCSNGLDGNSACTTQTITAGFCGDGSYPCSINLNCSGDQICSEGFCIDEGFEECDDGNTNNNDGCIIDENVWPNYMCMLATCGDGYLWNQNGGSETCDPEMFQACGLGDQTCCPAGTFRACSCVSGSSGCNF